MSSRIEFIYEDPEEPQFHYGCRMWFGPKIAVFYPLPTGLHGNTLPDGNVPTYIKHCQARLDKRCIDLEGPDWQVVLARFNRLCSFDPVNRTYKALELSDSTTNEVRLFIEEKLRDQQKP